MVQLWKDVLGVQQVGLLDDFFHLGGQSILAIRLVALIRKKFQIDIGISAVFEYPVLKDLTNYIETIDQGAQVTITTQERPNHIPLSFMQERIWIIDQLNGSTQYHMPALFNVGKSLQKDVLIKAFKQVLNRHESLRTIFYQQDNTVYQKIISETDFAIKDIPQSLYKNSNLFYEELRNLVSIPFDLSKDYMVRAGHMVTGQGDHILLIEMHHIASDGWSIDLFVQELIEVYDALLHHTKAQLPNIANSICRL